jgi:hypothetical protein
MVIVSRLCVSDLQKCHSTIDVVNGAFYVNEFPLFVSHKSICPSLRWERSTGPHRPSHVTIIRIRTMPTAETDPAILSKCMTATVNFRSPTRQCAATRLARNGLLSVLETAAGHIGN